MEKKEKGKFSLNKLSSKTDLGLTKMFHYMKAEILYSNFDSPPPLILYFILNISDKKLC